MQKKINLQDLFLLRLRQERLPVTVFLMNGFQMRGTVTGYDPFCGGAGKRRQAAGDLQTRHFHSGPPSSGGPAGK